MAQMIVLRNAVSQGLHPEKIVTSAQLILPLGKKIVARPHIRRKHWHSWTMCGERISGQPQAWREIDWICPSCWWLFEMRHRDPICERCGVTLPWWDTKPGQLFCHYCEHVLAALRVA